MNVRFTKMQGLGNDYLYVYGEAPDNVADICVRLSDRHFGVGSDGMIYISPSAAADFRMRIFNADGSEAAMCGNGIRCVGKYVYDKGYTDKTRLTVETKAGVKTVELTLVGGRVKRASVDMGEVSVAPGLTLTAGGESICVTPVSVGNPHAVIFVDDAPAAPVERLGPLVEKHPLFPGGVNVEFAQVISPGHIRMRVWERGSGVTMACGTGACACVAAAMSKGLCEPGSPVSVRLDGGELLISVSDDKRTIMTGPAETVCEGEAVC